MDKTKVSISHDQHSVVSKYILITSSNSVPLEFLTERATDDCGLWQTSWIHDICDTSIPHIGCNLIQDAVPDDHLMRSELMCVTVLMAARLHERKYEAHRIVLVSSQV